MLTSRTGVAKLLEQVSEWPFMVIHFGEFSYIFHSFPKHNSIFFNVINISGGISAGKASWWHR